MIELRLTRTLHPSLNYKFLQGYKSAKFELKVLLRRSVCVWTHFMSVEVADYTQNSLPVTCFWSSQIESLYLSRRFFVFAKI